MRKFIVSYKPTGTLTNIDGVEALAKHLGVPVSQIPPIRMFRVTYGDNVVCERLTEEQKANWRQS